MIKNREEQLDAGILEVVDRYPLLKLWGKYMQRASSYSHLFKWDNFPEPQNKKFAAWRKRRIAAAQSELGYLGYMISYPILAFELSDGCSVGCWFCSFATKKLKGILDYNTSRDYFRRIVQHCIDLFGKEQAGMALPYYRTEPHDNPNYIDFLPGKPPGWLVLTVIFRKCPWVCIRWSVKGVPTCPEGKGRGF